MKNWISSAIIYQVNLRSLAARDPRNAIEAFKTAAGRRLESPLTYLARNLGVIKKLGANVVYLLPPYPMGLHGRKGIGSPYSSRDFYSVEPEYGTKEELADLVRRAHRMRLKVILDITPNHTARDHAWIASNPEYYVKAPNGEPFYDCDWSDTAKLDYTAPGLRREMIEVYHHWLSFLGRDAEGQPDGVDGFRLDMAHFINDKSFWNEAMPELKARHPSRQLLFLAECYGTQNNMDLFARGINAAYDDDFYKTFSFLYGVDEEGRSVICPSPDAETNGDFLDKWEAFKARGLAGAVETALLNYESILPPDEDSPRLARYTDNHDEGRGLYRAGPGAVRAMMQVAFLSGHSLPFILTGQEFGALNRPSIHARIGLCDKGRRVQTPRGARVESGLEWEGNLFARTAEERSDWFRFYRDLIQLRLKSRELLRGRFQLIDAGEDVPPAQRTVIAFERRLRRSALRCAVNLGPEPRALASFCPQPGETVLYGQMTGSALPPFCAIVVRAG